IVAHEVTNSGSDRAQLANMAKQAKAVLKSETLEQPRDPRVPRSWHHSDAAQTVDIGCQIRGPLRQAGLCLFTGGRRLALCGWGAAAVSLYKRRRRQGAAALLDHSLSKLCPQIAMHNRARAADYTMGARALARGCAAAPRCKSESDASASRDSRASVRNDEGSHGGDALPHKNTSKSS